VVSLITMAYDKIECPDLMDWLVILWSLKYDVTYFCYPNHLTLTLDDAKESRASSINVIIPSLITICEEF